MTVIAWDGKTLAADREANSGGSVYSTTKVFCIGDQLVGISGEYLRGLAMIDWLRSGALRDAFPARATDDGRGNLLVISSDGSMVRYEDSPYPIPVEESCYATGSGADAARAVMLMGGDACRAVEIASLIDEGCGRGVDTLTFDDS